MTPAQTKLAAACGFVAIACLLSFYGGRCSRTCPTVAASTVDVRTVDKPYPVYVPKIVYKYLRATVTPVVAESATTDAGILTYESYRADSAATHCPDFIAEVDTTIDSNDLHLWYYSAEQRFAVDIRRNAPLIAMIPTTTIATKETTYEKREWWIDGLTHVGAFALGAGIGSLIK